MSEIRTTHPSDAESLTLCCGGKKCPVATKRPDGGVTLTDIDASGQEHRIVLTADQYRMLTEFQSTR